jgi:hypothetical protein
LLCWQGKLLITLCGCVIVRILAGLTKKLEALGNQREGHEVRTWTKSIINHLYWSAASSACGDEVVAKWESIVNHVQNVHEHDNWMFPRCLHGELDNRQWLLPCELKVGFCHR